MVKGKSPIGAPSRKGQDMLMNEKGKEEGKGGLRWTDGLMGPAIPGPPTIGEDMTVGTIQGRTVMQPT